MPMTQESMWLISMPNAAKAVSQINIPPKTLSKGSGWGKDILLWSFQQNKRGIKLNFVLNSSAYMQRISSNIFLILGSKHFTSENGVLVLFCFLKTIFVLCHQESKFNRHSMLLNVRNMPHLIVQKLSETNVKTSCHRLVVTSQPKWTIFSHRKRWVVLMFKRH